ncbi:substrate-binding domain-containing protein [Grimontia marina]|uniref:Autoinducer 2-binding periplasmic protein LuxP n=1 Tax=Grimontia marina TaxID=646534 RepID=A0A128FGJ0_9GAMM|nr:substrate-binding domain-containing protein [Grimontia marina]CZF85908.1 D-ribose-binding periplasmic protein precursor [Grimontia marina]
MYRLVLTFMLLALIQPPVAAAIKAGVSVTDLTNPYFVTVVRTIMEEVQERFGEDSVVLVRSSAYDHPRQVRQLNEFMAEEVDVVFLVASNEHKIGPYVKRLFRHGIPVFAIDVRADGATATVTTDNLRAGQVACHGLAKVLGGKGNVLIINGPQVSAVIERVEGCKEALTQYPMLTFLGDSLNGTGSVEGGLEKMAYAMQLYDDIDGIFAINDRTALGAESALLQAKSKAVIISVDGSPDAKSAFIDQRPNWIGSAIQSPETMTREAVKIAERWLQSGQIEKQDVLIPTRLMTPENANTFKEW